jgi:hypothetical protein
MDLRQELSFPTDSQLQEFLRPVPGRSGRELELRLDYVFHVTRGRLLGISPASDLSVSLPQFPHPNVLRLSIPWPQPPGRRLIVASAHEHLEPVKIIVFDEPGQALAVFEPDPCSGTFLQYGPPQADWQDISATLDVPTFMAALDAELTVSTAPEVPFQRFFRDLDRQTNPVLIDELVNQGELDALDAAMRLGHIASVLNELRERVRVRAKSVHLGAPDLLLAGRVFPHLQSRVQALSDLLLGIVDTHFGPYLPAFEEAFEKFANGELRLQLPGLARTTQPSSGYYFLFGEFALMAADHGVAPARWTDLANVLVRTQLVFVRVYGPAVRAGADFSTYGAWNYACNGTPYTTAELAGLKTTFTGADLRVQAADHAIENLPALLL